MEDAVSSPEAKEAARRDDIDQRHNHMQASKNQYLEAFKQSRSKAGINVQGFLDQDEMILAMSDPAYDKSQEYRDAVAEILSHTSAEVVGVSATSYNPDGSQVQIGQAYVSEKATVESMVENAYRDAVLEAMGKLDLSTAAGRLEHITYFTKPENKWLIEYQQSLVTTPQQRTQQAMLDSQAAGHRDEITIRETSPNDGSVDDGSVTGEGGK